MRVEKNNKIEDVNHISTIRDSETECLLINNNKPTNKELMGYT